MVLFLFYLLKHVRSCGLLYVVTIGGYLPSVAQNGDSLARAYTTRAATYMVKDAAVQDYYSIDSQGIAMYSNRSAKAKGVAEFYLPWEQLATFKAMVAGTERAFQLSFYYSGGKEELPFWLDNSMAILTANLQQKVALPALPLAGWRIALDPGHVASNLRMGKIERRYIDMVLPKGDTVEMTEGVLTLQTARILKEKLVKLGAEVLITREELNNSLNHHQFKWWIRRRLPRHLRRYGYTDEEALQWMRTHSEQDAFAEYYSSRDIELRAKAINNFQPDFTLILHYNADVENARLQQPSAQNYAMLFIPGAFQSSEMLSKENRFDFLRILLSSYPEQSQQLGKLLMDQIATRLRVPPADATANPPAYLQENCLWLASGVYSRNLRLCSLINSPVVYAEPLLQDAASEIARLNQYKLSNDQAPERIYEVAEAYLQACINYTQVQMAKK